MAVGERDELFVTVPEAGQVWRLDGEGRGTAFAGVGQDEDTYWEGVDGLNAGEVALEDPRGVAVDGGTVYVGTAHGVVRIDESGTALTVAGADRAVGAVGALALDRHGDLYFSDLSSAQVSVLIQPTRIEDPFHWEHIVGIAAVGVIVLFGVVRFGPSLWRRVMGGQDASARDEAENSAAEVRPGGSDVDTDDGDDWFDDRSQR
ncbi:hypothetical protein BJF85_01370 [Saccharomonospora sp. CUA-673]|uniref:hypothetical protein n=1 Tax=Saccharomonospora sp. CUA-673 TaxID=1904969 RepID=UPI000960B7E0|nr:hypothetical protein [Saccharomonospora sp. CUA-673]OLT47078.1 hypothetical protein BJF85_01370 [Saccharomonospora sp. CUA-673]